MAEIAKSAPYPGQYHEAELFVLIGERGVFGGAVRGGTGNAHRLVAPVVGAHRAGEVVGAGCGGMGVPL